MDTSRGMSGQTPHCNQVDRVLTALARDGPGGKLVGVKPSADSTLPDHSLNPIPPPLFSPQTHSPFLSHFPPISDMSQPSSMSSISSFQGLFNAALQEYENQTGTTLPDHPFTKQLETCDFADSITAILQEQVQIFRQSRRDDAKIMKPLKSSVDILYTLSNSSVFGQGIGLVHSKSFIGFSFFLIVIPQIFPPANAIFAGIAILLSVGPFLRFHLHKP